VADVCVVVIVVTHVSPTVAEAVADGQYEPLTTQVHAMVAAAAADGTMAYP